MEISALHTQTRFHFWNSRNVLHQRQCVKAIVPFQFSKGKCFSLEMGSTAQKLAFQRTILKQSFATKSVLAGLDDTRATSSEFQEFSVRTCQTDKANEMKISMEVSGTRTEAIFDNVFSRMVADAQPIPGFLRVKGGKTPNIPKNILLEILGPSKVYKKVIERVINSTISEFVQKEGLSVAKDLRVEQSLEELEAMFEPGENFKFEAIIQCQQTDTDPLTP